VNVALWVTGAALVALAAWRARRPLARMNELDRLAENARRYDSWRGGRNSGAEETTGADVMRQILRRQVLTWTIVGAAGVAMIVAGFVMR
jgi:hypothetical protein